MKQYYMTTNYSLNQQMAIQQDHAIKRMMLNLLDSPESTEMSVFKEYIEKYETTICLGVSQPTELIKFYSYMYKHKDELNIPMNIFQELSMNKTVTALTFILNKKLSLPVFPTFSKLLKEQKIKSLYDIKENINFGNHDNSFIVNIEMVNSIPVFKIRMIYKNFKSNQNEDIMELDFSPEKMDDIYKKYNEKDYNYYSNEPIEENELLNDNVVSEETFSLSEMIFLQDLRRFSLKS